MTVVEQQYTEPPDELSDEVVELLESKIYSTDALTKGSSISYGYLVDNLYSQCVNVKDELEVDNYIEVLEELIWGLVRQRDFLFSALESNNLYAKDSGSMQIIKDVGVDTFKKFILYCAAGVDNTTTEHSRRFYSDQSFHAAVQLHSILPEEWKERGAKFIQVYAANYFETEFRGSTL